MGIWFFEIRDEASSNFDDLYGGSMRRPSGRKLKDLVEEGLYLF
jgi:hypothetical protein